MLEKLQVYPIGRINKQDENVFIEIDPQFAPGLLGIAEFSHIAVLYWFDRNDTPEIRRTLQVHPMKNPAKPLTGVFATHSPRRPNLIAYAVCKLIAVEGNQLRIESIDAEDGSPVVDIKCYIPEKVDPGDLRLAAWLDR
jgi:tRNA-Thr(GGU) m(6)t(6)A37 methyltransferase TsaA